MICWNLGHVMAFLWRFRAKSLSSRCSASQNLLGWVLKGRRPRSLFELKPRHHSVVLIFSPLFHSIAKTACAVVETWWYLGPWQMPMRGTGIVNLQDAKETRSEGREGRRVRKKDRNKEKLRNPGYLCSRLVGTCFGGQGRRCRGRFAWTGPGAASLSKLEACWMFSKTFDTLVDLTLPKYRLHVKHQLVTTTTDLQRGFAFSLKNWDSNKGRISSSLAGKWHVQGPEEQCESCKGRDSKQSEILWSTIANCCIYII